MSGEIKAYVGGAFAWKPVKVWNGSSWVTKPLKYWDGGTWRLTNSVATITTPVIAQTSPAGTAPFTFDITMNLSDTFAGDTLHVQWTQGTTTPTKDGNGNYTSGTVSNVYHMLTEGEMLDASENPDAIDITADGFATWSGAGSFHVRIERDDGTNSAWSNDVTDTISSATAQWAGTNGFDKSSLVTVSGSPRLTVVGSSAGYAYVRTTQSAVPNEFVWEYTVGSVVDGRLGMDDRAIDFTSYSGFPGGFSDSGFYLVLSATSMEIWYMGSGGATNVSFGVAAATGDKIAIIGNKTTGVVKLERWRSGVKTQLGSAGGYTLVGMASWYIYHGSNAGGGGTLNTGQSTFAHTLTGSEAAFG